MASTQSPHPPQMLGQSPFFYYNPETSPERGQHGLFSAQSNAVSDNNRTQQYQQQIYHQGLVMHGQSHMMCQPPSSSAPAYLPSNAAFTMPPVLTPVASPRPLHQKAAFLYQQENQQLSLDTGCATPEVCIYPSTPPLSVSGSSISSPPSACGIRPTPVTGTLFTLENIEGVKEGCESEVQSEILAGGEWTRCCSPPLTPGMFDSPFPHRALSQAFRKHQTLPAECALFWGAKMALKKCAG